MTKELIELGGPNGLAFVIASNLATAKIFKKSTCMAGCSLWVDSKQCLDEQLKTHQEHGNPEDSFAVSVYKEVWSLTRAWFALIADPEVEAMLTS